MGGRFQQVATSGFGQGGLVSWPNDPHVLFHVLHLRLHLLAIDWGVDLLLVLRQKERMAHHLFQKAQKETEEQKCEATAHWQDFQLLEEEISSKGRFFT